MSQKNRLSLIPIAETLVQFGRKLAEIIGVRYNLSFYVQSLSRKGFYGRERKFEITVYLKWSFWSTYRLCYALCTHSCNTHCIQMHTRHLQLTRLFWRPLQDLTTKLQKSPCYISLEAHLSCFAKALLLVWMKTKHNKTPSSFSTSFSFLSSIFLFYFGNLFTRLSCFLPASLPVHHSHPVHLSLAGGIAFARETLLCVLQHILLCSPSPSGPGAVHFLGNIPVLKRIGVIVHCKLSEASAMHKHKERKQGEF